MKLFLSTLLLAGTFPLTVGSAVAAGSGTSINETSTSGILKSPNIEKVREQALAWFKSTGKNDGDSLRRFDIIWRQENRPLLDLVVDTIVLGDSRAATLLQQMKDPETPAPTEVPALLRDKAQPTFYRSNLSLACARALTQRRAFEETLAMLRQIKPEQVVDPAGYFFQRAVAEHALMLKNEANRSIIGLIEDVSDTPERYKQVATLMYLDMDSWKQKDLGDIARKMDNIERRLELARGGPQTQKMQKEVLARLDEIIKRLEKPPSGSNGGACPSGGNRQPSGGQGSTPMPDSNIANNGGPGNVDQKKLSGLAKEWGKLPEKERAKAMMELTRDMPPRYREVIENYFKKLAQSQPSQP